MIKTRGDLNIRQRSGTWKLVHTGPCLTVEAGRPEACSPK